LQHHCQIAKEESEVLHCISETVTRHHFRNNETGFRLARQIPRAHSTDTKTFTIPSITASVNMEQTRTGTTNNDSLRFIYDLDDEVERLAMMATAAGTATDPPSRNSSSKNGKQINSLSFDDSVSTAPLSLLDWSSHHDDEDDDDDHHHLEEMDFYYHDRHHQQHLQRPSPVTVTPPRRDMYECYNHNSPKRGSHKSCPQNKNRSKPKLKYNTSKLGSGLSKTLKVATSPVVLATRSVKKNFSPKKIINKNKNKNNMTDWQQELGLPPGTTEEQAIAVLLTRELTALEL
jgi:hypothetical protein